jgi:hypothetical protein
MQELLRRYKEGILVKNAADDDHRVRSYDVNHRFPSKLRKKVRADDRIIVVAPHIIYARFEFDDIVYVRSAFDGPVHVADNAAERKSSLGVPAGQLLERREYPILIETALPKVRFGVGPKLELPSLLGSRRVDPCRSQPLEMVETLIRINHVNRLVATREPVLNERKQHAILFVVAVEKRAHMTCFAELRAGKGDGCEIPLHGVFLP